MSMNNQFETDTQYTAETIERADPSLSGDEKGWTLSFEGGHGLWCTAAECQVEPQPGEQARLYGKGFGYTVRGIAINGRCYRYLTAEQEDERHTKWCEELTAKRAADAERHRAEIAEGAHAPVAFRVKESARAQYERGLANNTDPYGRACYLFAADWAALMEARIANGSTVAAVAKDACGAADKKHGITGFMYGCAVNILSHCWEHGEELRRWHNLDTQVGKEGEKANESGGVLNPAILSIG